MQRHVTIVKQKVNKNDLLAISSRNNIHINKNNVMFICTNDIKTKYSDETFKCALMDIIKI